MLHHVSLTAPFVHIFMIVVLHTFASYYVACFYILLYCMHLHATLLHAPTFYFTVCICILLYCMHLHSTLLHASTFYFTVCICILLYCMHLHSTLLHASTFYFTACIYILLYCMHLHSTLLYASAFYFTACIYILLYNMHLHSIIDRFIYILLLDASVFYSTTVRIIDSTFCYYMHQPSISICIYRYFLHFMRLRSARLHASIFLL